VSPAERGPGAFADLLRRHRTATGLSQAELAARSGLSVRAIRDMEHGRSSSPRSRSARLLADALGLAGPGRDELIDAARGRPGPGLAAPRQLPPERAPFVGREAELKTLSALHDGAGASGTVVISVIGGTAGIGKTALAVRWARQAAPDFPDGQLYVNLRGYDPSGPPVTAAAAVRTLLDALGAAPEHVPASFEAQVGLYRSLAAGRRLLVLLDNARDADQVRPLLPGSPGSLVLVTSRAWLAGLAIGEGAHQLTLDVLAEDEARQLLADRLGEQRAAAEPGAVDELINLCARLPLALAITAARAARRPRVPLAALAAELREAADRLDALDHRPLDHRPLDHRGAAGGSIRAAFSWSYQSLGEPAARLFRLLGVHPGPDISAAAAASLAGVTPSAARRDLNGLTAAHLLTEHLPGRFTFHDLLRAYAAELAGAADRPDERRQAAGRMLDHYLHTAYQGATLLQPQRGSLSLPPARPGVAPEPLADRQQALAWFEAEHQVLLAAAARAAAAGFDRQAWQLPWSMASFLDWRGHWRDWAAIQPAALAAAARLGDRAGRATAERTAAAAYARLGAYDQARTHMADCLELYRQLGNRTGEAAMHQDLSWVAEQQGRGADALGHAEQALALFRAVGNRGGQAGALNNLGWYQSLLGDFQRARESCRQALDLYRDLDARYGEAHAWDSLGYAEYKLGDLAEAADCYACALGLFRELGDRYYEADVLGHIGDARRAAGDLRAARGAWRQALAILDDLAHADAEKIRAKLRAPAAEPGGR